MITQNIIGYNLSSQSSKRIYAFDPQQLIQLPKVFRRQPRMKLI
jgi:hypothetical protein